MFIQKFKSFEVATYFQFSRYPVRCVSGKVEINSAGLKSWKDIPGPSSLPFLGQLHNFLPGGFLYNCAGREFWNHLYELYGPLVRINSVLKPDLAVLFDAEEVAKVYHRENWLPMRPAFFSLEYFRKYYNRPKDHHLRPSGLVTENGEKWKQLRLKVNSTMLDTQNVKNYSASINQVAFDMIERLKSCRDSDNVLRGDFNKEMNLWALESIGMIALGRRINCLDSNIDDPLVLKLIQRTHELFEIGSKLDYKPTIWKYYATKNFKHAMKAYEDVEFITKHYVDMALKDLKTKANNSGEERSILEKLLEIDENAAYIMAMDMLVAGIDTTSNVMIATFYHLATNPEKQQKLRDEALSNHKTPYLKACIKESLRMLPVVGLNLRQLTKDYEIMGYYIPKGKSLLFCHEHMSMMEKYFPKPSEYIPERWLDDVTDPINPNLGHKFCSMPFGFGVRVCVGRRIAELEMEIFLARVIENFEIGWVGPPPNICATHINKVKTCNNFIFKDINK